MFVQRNDRGEIIAISQQQTADCQEAVAEHSEELHVFAQRYLLDTIPHEAQHQLQQSDSDLARVLEDVIDLLAVKGLIQFTDLPEAAQSKLLRRKHIRQHARNLNLIDDNEPDDSFLP